MPRLETSCFQMGMGLTVASGLYVLETPCTFMTLVYTYSTEVVLMTLCKVCMYISTLS